MYKRLTSTILALSLIMLSIPYLGNAHDYTKMVSQSLVDVNRSELTVSQEVYTVTNQWSTTLPERLKENIQYSEYTLAYDYFLVTASILNVREAPTTESKVINQIKYFNKVNLIQELKGEYLHRYGSDKWYRIFWYEQDEIKFGYVFSKLGIPRSFRFDKMLSEVEKLQKTIENTTIAYIYNYKNVNGRPPFYNGKSTDEFGYPRGQSAPGYTDLAKSDFRYFPDGMLVSILDEIEGYYKVSTPSFEGEYYIPKKYIFFRNAPEKLEKVVVIDDKNQNEGVFQWIEEQWELISYTYATTGYDGEFSYETPKGHFMVVQKRPYFLYLEDGTSNIGGFAPYALRFSGGGYVHGVPVDFTNGQNHLNTNLRNPELYEEYLFTIGTTPRSHKCVRNFTSHAKFLYDWAEIGKTSVIVIK